MSNQNFIEQNIGAVAQNMFFCQVLAFTLPFYYKKTGIKPIFKFTANEDGLEIDLGFFPRQPTDDEFKMFIDDILDSEQLILNNQLLNISHGYDNLSELKENFKKQMQTIASKRKQYYLDNI